MLSGWSMYLEIPTFAHKDIYYLSSANPMCNICDDYIISFHTVSTNRRVAG